jgi:hypothetical protein
LHRLPWQRPAAFLNRSAAAIAYPPASAAGSGTPARLLIGANVSEIILSRKHIHAHNSFSGPAPRALAIFFVLDHG